MGLRGVLGHITNGDALLTTSVQVDVVVSRASLVGDISELIHVDPIFLVLQSSLFHCSSSYILVKTTSKNYIGTISASNLCKSFLIPKQQCLASY